MFAVSEKQASGPEYPAQHFKLALCKIVTICNKLAACHQIMGF